MNFKNTEFSKILNAGKQEKRYFFVLSKNKRVKKAKLLCFCSVYIPKKSHHKTPDLFSICTKGKETYWPLKERARKVISRSATPISAITNTETVSEKYLIPTASIIHNTLKTLLLGDCWEFVLT